MVIVPNNGSLSGKNVRQLIQTMFNAGLHSTPVRPGLLAFHGLPRVRVQYRRRSRPDVLSSAGMREIYKSQSMYMKKLNSRLEPE